MNQDLMQLLEQVRAGSLSAEEAAERLRREAFVDLGYAKVDLHRAARQGTAEVIYGAGKTPEQIVGIAKTLLQAGQEPVLITRLSAEAAQTVSAALKLQYYPEARCGVVGTLPDPDGLGPVVIATGGTSDLPVAEEAAVTARVLGSEVIRLYDVGVAGLHRLLSSLELLSGASVIIVIAGVEGALASVVGGLVSCPVIAVPTSVGYGASFQGLSALLSMLNSCASGVSVVNIDNGFGAGFLANRINHMCLNRKDSNHADTIP